MTEDKTNITWPGWEVVRLIGRGSFGTVYEIQRQVFNDTEQAALKVISIPQNSSDIEEMYSDGYDDESITSTFKSHLESIVAEYTLMRKMNGSANIVNCEDVRYVQHDDGIGWDIFIKMELLTPMTRALPINPSEETVLRIARDMCQALELCKKHGIVHRDIKPQNIFVSQFGDYKLGDFGIAKTVERTMGGTKIGTYKYMAPEVYNNQPYGSSADLYSLGLVLYWLLNERRMPFMPLPPQRPQAGEEERSRNRRLSGEPLPPPAHGSAALQAIVMKACAYSPQDRYASATEMLEDVRALTGEAKPFPAAVPVIEPVPVPAVKPEPVSVPEPAPESEPAAESMSKAAPKSDPEPVAAARKQPAPQQKKRFPLAALLVIPVVLIAALFLLLRGGDGSESDTPDANPVQLDWTEWLSELPEDVTEVDYEIEEQTLYSSRELKTTSSESKTKDGWELYDTVEAGDGFGPWSDWSSTKVSSSDTREVETKKVYRYRDRQTTTSSKSSLSGWDLYDTTYSWGSYGSWSSWSTESVSKSDSRKVESKKQYRYRSITTSQKYSDWSSWSDWSTNAVSSNSARGVETKKQYRYRNIYTSREYTDWSSWSDWQDSAVGSSDLQDVETRTVWGYYYFQCPYCGTHWHGHTNVYCWSSWGTGGCGNPNPIPESSAHQIWSTTSWNDAGLREWHGTGKYYTYNITGDLVFKWDNGDGDPKTQYRYRTRSLKNVTSYGDWSSWSDTSYSSSSTREVQTRTLYRYRTRTLMNVTNYGDWSSWSDTSYSSSSTREVQSRTMYRYCDRSRVPTYHFRRWGSWSSWSTSSVSEKSDRQVEAATWYRSRDQVSKTTYYFRQWSDWTDYSDQVVEPSDTVEVKTQLQYRYKSKST